MSTDRLKNFCIVPWRQLRINQDGHVYPCCRISEKNSLGQINTQKLKQIWNGAPIQSLRGQFLNQVAPKECSDCFKVEKSGGRSLRQEMNERFFSENNLPLEDFTLIVDSQKLQSLDLRFGNICNFSCRTCHPEYSTSWHSDALALSGKQYQVYNLNKMSPDLINDILNQKNDLKRIYFAGGEPLLQESHYFLLKQLIRSGNKNIEIAYNSNLSTLEWRGESVLELWRNFKNVSLCVSLDGLYEKSEYIRKGTKWSDLNQNIDLVLNEKNLTVTWAPTISAINVFHAPEILKFILSKSNPTCERSVSLNFISEPRYLGINILNDIEKKRLIESVESHLQEIPMNLNESSQVIMKRELQRIVFEINQSEYSEELRRKFKVFNLKLDRRRQENLVRYFPEVSSLYLLP